MKSRTLLGSLPRAGDTATESRADRHETLDPSDQTTQTAASFEKRTLALLHRQHRRDVLKRKRDRNKISELPGRDGLLSDSSFRKSSRSWRKDKGGAADTTPCLTVGHCGKTLDPSCQIRQLKGQSQQLRQLREENEQLRNMLEASKRSSTEGEPSCWDLIPCPEAEEICWAGACPPSFTGGCKDAMPSFQQDLGLRHLSAGSSDFLFTAWEPMTTTIPCAKPGPGNVEQALWEAANRPARPEGWASMPSPPWPVSHMEAHANTLGANGFTTRTAPTYSPQPRPSGQQQLNRVSNLPQAPRAGLRKVHSVPEQPHSLQQDDLELYSRRSMPTSVWGSHPSAPLDDASLFVLPDIPGGLESVDQFATHIPIA